MSGKTIDLAALADALTVAGFDVGYNPVTTPGACLDVHFRSSGRLNVGRDGAVFVTNDEVLDDFSDDLICDGFAITNEVWKALGIVRKAME